MVFIMAKKWIDEKSGCNMIDADTVYEYLWMIWAVGCEYDGCNTVESLKGLVDELVDYANKACDCLLAGRLFPAHDEPKLVNTPDKERLQTMYDKIRENIESTWPDWKIEIANAELITSKHGKKLRTKAEREQDKNGA